MPIQVHHIPVCPFCQRLEILLELKGCRPAVEFKVVDITKPRPAWLLEKTRGSTALPVLETADGRVLRESLVLMQYLEDLLPGPPVARSDPYERAVEQLLVRMEGELVTRGYTLVMNQNPSQRSTLQASLLETYARISAFLEEHSPRGPWLFDRFGWAEAVYTPVFQRFWFLEYYEGFDLPQDSRYARVRQWRDACVAHPGAQQACREEIIKLYYDYARGAGNGALLPGRKVSSFAFEPHWRDRPMPPSDKYGLEPTASDDALGLLGSPRAGSDGAVA